jgi:hypothetical protein
MIAPVRTASVWADPRSETILARISERRRLRGLAPLSREEAEDIVRDRLRDLDRLDRWFTRQTTKRERFVHPALKQGRPR